MQSESTSTKQVGCGCGGCLVTIFAIIFAYLFICLLRGTFEVNGQKWNLDLYPPKIWNMNEEPVNADDTSSIGSEERIVETGTD